MTVLTRRFAFAIVLAVLAASGRAQPLVLSEPIPDDAILEARGAVIGEITIRTVDIFDTDDPREDKAVFRFANRLHRITRPSVIENELLFSTGDPYSARLIAETERHLRALRFLFDADIRPVRYVGNRVDLEVVTRDVWTITGAASLSRSGGENSYRFELQDASFLGTGKDLTLQQITDVDRTTTMLRYRDPNVAGSRTRLEAEYADNSDGGRQVLSFERPFYSLDTRWAAGFRLVTDERIEPLYARGEIRDRIGHRQDFVEVFAGRSRGLLDGRVRRWSVGATYQSDALGVAEGFEAPVQVPEDRRLVYPWIQLDVVKDAFVESFDLDQIGRVEDRHLGLWLRARLGYSAELWGGDRDRLVFSTTIGHSLAPRLGHLLETELRGAGRWGRDGAENVLLSARGRYYWRDFGDHLFFVSLQADYADRLDGERQLLLGGDSGLRGYPLRYQDGDRRVLLTVEQRFFTDWNLFRLFRIGGAVFVDLGRAWFEGAPALPGDGGDGLLRDVGFGLRIGQSRSSRGAMTHVDVAFPFDGDDSIRSVQFLIRSSETF